MGFFSFDFLLGGIFLFLLHRSDTISRLVMSYGDTALYSIVYHVVVLHSQ